MTILNESVSYSAPTLARRPIGITTVILPGILTTFNSVHGFAIRHCLSRNSVSEMCEPVLRELYPHWVELEPMISFHWLSSPSVEYNNTILSPIFHQLRLSGRSGRILLTRLLTRNALRQSCRLLRFFFNFLGMLTETSLSPCENSSISGCLDRKLWLSIGGQRCAAEQVFWDCNFIVQNIFARLNRLEAERCSCDGRIGWRRYLISYVVAIHSVVVRQIKCRRGYRRLDWHSPSWDICGVDVTSIRQPKVGYTK